jgi:hypothetical protein
MAIAESQTPMNRAVETSMRIQVVARNYWPLADESSQRLMHTLDAWQSIGVEPSVLTTRWNASWTDRARLRKVAVERLLPPPSSSWNESHFQRNVTKWLIKNADNFDAIYVDAADHLLSAIVSKASSIGRPVLSRFSQDPLSLAIPKSLGAYLPSSVSIRDSLRKCHAVIADHRRGYEALLDLGVSKQQSIWIPDAVFEPARRTEIERKMAARALFDVSGDLAIPAQTHLLVHFGQASMEQLEGVLQTVCGLLDRGVHLRMWLINPGPDTPKIYQWLRHQGWHREILIFDGFDVLEDLICIADLVIASNPACSLQYSSRLVLESQVPMIVAQEPSIGEWMPETPLMKWYHSKDTLAAQLADWLMHRSQWEAEAIALRRHYRQHHPNQHWLDRWRSLFSEAILKNQHGTSGKSFK